MSHNRLSIPLAEACQENAALRARIAELEKGLTFQQIACLEGLSSVYQKQRDGYVAELQAEHSARQKAEAERDKYRYACLSERSRAEKAEANSKRILEQNDSLTRLMNEIGERLDEAEIYEDSYSVSIAILTEQRNRFRRALKAEQDAHAISLQAEQSQRISERARAERYLAAMTAVVTVLDDADIKHWELRIRAIVEEARRAK